MSNITPVLLYIHITLSLVCLLKKVQGHIEESSLGAVLYDDVATIQVHRGHVTPQETTKTEPEAREGKGPMGSNRAPGSQWV